MFRTRRPARHQYVRDRTDAETLANQVLISPISVAGIDWKGRRVQVDLTKQQIEAIPPIETDKPVSRQRETAFFDYYAYPYYWGGPSRWGTTSNPVSRATSAPHGFGALSEDVALALPNNPLLRRSPERFRHALGSAEITPPARRGHGPRSRPAHRRLPAPDDSDRILCAPTFDIAAKAKMTPAAGAPTIPQPLPPALSVI